MNYGPNIEAIRKRNGWSRATLAELNDKSDMTIYNWETGASEPRLSEAVKLAETLGVSLLELVGQKPEPKHLLEYELALIQREREILAILSKN